MAVELATAYVSLVPSFKGGAASIAQTMGGPATAAGVQAGKRFGGGFAGGVKKFGIIAGAGLAAAGVGLFQIGKTFDKVSDTIRVGTGATGKALDGLVQSARNVGKDVPSSFQDISVAIADLNTRTGLAGKPLETLAGQFLNMTRLTGGDLSTNIQTVTRLFGDWSISAEDQSATMDKLFRASQATGIGIDELSTLMVQFGSPLRQLGLDFDFSAAMFARFEKEGVNIQTAMPGLRMALKNFAKAGRDPAEALMETFEAIKNAGSAAEANTIAFETFGTRAGPDMAAAIREGRFDLEELMATISDGSDTINTASKDTASFAESWQIFKNRALLAIEPVARRVFDVLGRGMQWISDVGAPAFGRLVNDVRPFAAALMADVVPAVKSLGGFLKDSVIPAVADFAGWLRRYQGWLLPVAAAIGTFVVALKAYRIAVLLLTKAKAAWIAVQAALNAVLLLNPIFLVVAALAALGVALVVAWKRSETFRDVVKKVWESFRRFVQTAWDGIKAVFKALDTSHEATRRWGIKMKDSLVKAWQQLRDGVGAAWGAIKRNTIDKWVASMQRMRDKASELRKGVVDTWRKMRDATAKIWSSMVEKIKSPIRSAFKWINKNLIANLNKVTSKFGLTIGSLPEKFHTGGVVGGRGERIITALGGEGVLSHKGMQALGGKRNLDLLNSGGASGGFIDFIKEKVGSVGAAIAGWLKKGAAFALDKIMGVAIAASSVIPNDFSRKLVGGTLRELRSRVKAWGEGKDSLTDESSAGAAGPPVATSGWARPLRSGYRIGRGSRAHGYPAQDFPAPIGTPIFAPIAGRVIQSFDSAVSYGKRVMLSSPAGRIVLAHMSRRIAQLGDVVRAGQHVGNVGSTGNSTGPHLHLEIGNFDPLSFLRARGVQMDQGGTLQPGWNPVYNGTGGPETLRRVGIDPSVGPRESNGLTMRQLAQIVARETARQINGAVLVIDDRNRGRLIARDADLQGRTG